ncbi:MAG: GTPase Era [Aestuariivita sp.]|nr:GTPase Era [Aestuariivita sp.]
MSTRAGVVALIGESNAGKSTLMNRILGVKLSAVTHKVQTTRARIRGIITIDHSQIIFLDTPGLFQPRRRLDHAMIAAAWSGARDADVVLLLVEAQRGLTRGVRMILEEFAARPRADMVSVVINKIDRVAPEALLALSAELNALFVFRNTFMLSATSGNGVDDLTNWLAGQVPVGPWLYDADQISDSSLRVIAAEKTREQLLLRLHQEVPYQLMVETETWENRRDGSVKIEQVIYVMRKGHQGIVLGRKGETIRALGREARRELERFLACPVHLFLRVKVRPGWMEEPEFYAQVGLKFSDGNT